MNEYTAGIAFAGLSYSKVFDFAVFSANEYFFGSVERWTDLICDAYGIFRPWEKEALSHTIVNRVPNKCYLLCPSMKQVCVVHNLFRKKTLVETAITYFSLNSQTKHFFPASLTAYTIPYYSDEREVFVVVINQEKDIASLSAKQNEKGAVSVRINNPSVFAQAVACDEKTVEGFASCKTIAELTDSLMNTTDLPLRLPFSEVDKHPRKYQAKALFRESDYR